MKNFILILTCLVIALYVYLSIGRFRTLMKENDELRKSTNEIPSSAFR